MHLAHVENLLRQELQDEQELQDVALRGGRDQVSPENPAADQKRGLRELRKLPGSAAASGASKPPSRSLTSAQSHETLRGGSGASSRTRDEPEERPARSRVGSQLGSLGVEHAKLYHAVGMDLMQTLPEAANGYLQRAMKTAPKESWLLSEIMGSACVALNRLRRHSEALRMAEQALSPTPPPPPPPTTPHRPRHPHTRARAVTAAAPIGRRASSCGAWRAGRRCSSWRCCTTRARATSSSATRPRHCRRAALRRLRRLPSFGHRLPAASGSPRTPTTPTRPRPLLRPRQRRRG